MTGIGKLLDELACGVSGHIWIQNTGVDGLMVCDRCGAQEAAPRVGGAANDAPLDRGSIVPENRPWLEAPFTANGFM